MTGSASLPPDPQRFNALVWEIARQIPSGKVFTYGQIAGLIPPPEGFSPEEFNLYRARWVGAAMAQCPQDVPWQRVINAQGKISARPGAGQALQRERLEGEGVVFDAKDRVDLLRYGWEGPSAEWLRAHGLLPHDPEYRQGALF